VIFREEAEDENPSECDNIKGTSIIVSLKRGEVLQVGRLTGGENFVSKKTTFMLYALLDF